MQVIGDITAYGNLTPSRAAEEPAVKPPTPPPVLKDKDSATDTSKGGTSDTSERSTSGTKTTISHNKAGGLDLYA